MPRPVKVIVLQTAKAVPYTFTRALFASMEAVMKTTNIFCIRLEDRLRKALDDLAYQKRCSRGFIVRMLLLREAVRQGFIDPKESTKNAQIEQSNAGEGGT
jgi:predicted transcriptional regulator